MDAEASKAFKSAVRLRKYRSGQQVYSQGDAGAEMFRLRKGSVGFVVNHADGREMIFTLFRAGDCFGESSLIDGEARPQSAEALSDLEVEVLSRSDFHRIRQQFPSFGDALVRSATRQLRLVCSYFEDANMNPLAVRVARRIISAASHSAANGSDWSPELIPLSQSELASMTGVSRQSINKVLQALQSDGLIRIEYGGLLVLDSGAIEAMAASAG